MRSIADRHNDLARCRCAQTGACDHASIAVGDACGRGHFKDGTYLLIIANRELPTAADIPPMGVPIKRGAPAEIPVRTQARFLNGVDASIPTEIPALQAIVT